MRFLFCLIVLILGMGTARADPLTFYAGAGISFDNLSHFVLQVNPENTRNYPDISATSGKALIGFRPLHWFAIEADYLGTASTTGNFGDRSEVQAVAAYAVFLTGAQNFDLILQDGNQRVHAHGRRWHWCWRIGHGRGIGLGRRDAMAHRSLRLAA